MVVPQHIPSKIIYTLLVLVGQWPYQKPIDYIPRRCFALFFISAFAFVQIRTIYVSNFEVELMLKNAQLLSITLVGLINLITLYINSNYYEKMLEEMYNDWCVPRSEEETKIKEIYLAHSNMISQVSIIFFLVVTTIGIIISCMPVILDAVAPLNYTRHRALLFYLDLYIDDQKYFIVYMLFYYTSASTGVTVFAANLCILSTAVCHLCGMFQTLGYQLEHAFDIETIPNNGDIFFDLDNAVCNNVILCIKAHCRTERFSTLLQDCLSPIMFELFVSASIVLAFSLAQVADLERFSFESAANVAFNCSFLAICMYMGQLVINTSTEAGEKAYHGKWFNSPIRAQKLLLTIMECYSPHTIHAFKMTHMSLEAAQGVIRVAVSYCLMLRTF